MTHALSFNKSDTPTKLPTRLCLLQKLDIIWNNSYTIYYIIYAMPAGPNKAHGCEDRFTYYLILVMSSSCYLVSNGTALPLLRFWQDSFGFCATVSYLLRATDALICNEKLLPSNPPDTQTNYFPTPNIQLALSLGRPNARSIALSITRSSLPPKKPTHPTTQAMPPSRILGGIYTGAVKRSTVFPSCPRFLITKWIPLVHSSPFSICNTFSPHPFPSIFSFLI